MSNTLTCHACGNAVTTDEARPPCCLLGPRQIALNHGLFALVDFEDVAIVRRFRWGAVHDRYTWYASTFQTINGKSVQRTMHRLLMQATTGTQVDHVNGNGLDNRRHNLRFATNGQNGMNRRIPKNNTSGYKGVSWHKRQGCWHARIQFNKRKIMLGAFDDPKEAARVYNAKACELFGEYARLNEID